MFQPDRSNLIVALSAYSGLRGAAMAQSMGEANQMLCGSIFSHAHAMVLRFRRDLRCRIVGILRIRTRSG